MKPEINVTPLIDVLLVLLIIFMVISPLKPSKFEAKIPSETKNPGDEPPPLLLIAKIYGDSTLALNGLANLGTTDDPALLVNKLKGVFSERKKNGVFSQHSLPSQTLDERIQKTVFIKAPRTISYGNVIKVVDAVKGAGANPISLQIDDLD